MNPERYGRVKELLLSALARPAPERSTFLKSVCSEDPELRAEVESLLAREGRTATEARPAALAAFAACAFADLGPGHARPRPPDRIGPYRILGLLGEGGMGVVYRAGQEEPVQREVALKVMRAAADSPAVLARFESERQTLALMDHPNIARLLDAASTEDGRPYFVMELVRGAPLTDYCREAKVDARGRLRLFLDVCRAVRHAHRCGIIHRDLKPSNILVTLVHDQPVPKVIDFSIAKALGDGSAGAGARTRTGQLLGTLEYMSPEQARGAVHALDTRSDVYALGVILYELLADRLPHDLTDQPLHKAVRRIVDEPPSPLRRAATTATGRVDADLDTLVGKCLEKDPERRYGSAAELCEDLERYLSSRPILARPPSAPYLLRKLVSRHRVAFGVATLVVFFLLVFSVTVTVQFGIQRRERLRAENEALKARRINTFLQDMLAAADPARLGIGATVRDVLDTSARGIEGRFAGEPLVEADARLTIGSTYDALGRLQDAELHVRRGLELRRLAAGAAHPDTLLAQRQLGVVLLHRGRHAEAEAVLRETLESQRRLLEPDDPEIPMTMTALALVLKETGRPPGGAALAREALDAQRRLLGVDHLDTLATQTTLASILVSEWQYDQARELYEDVLEKQRRLLGPEHPDTLRTLHRLAITYAHLKRADEAISMIEDVLEARRRVLGPDHPETLSSALSLAKRHFDAGRWETAEPIYLQVLEARGRTLGEDHVDTTETRNHLAILYMTAGLSEKGGDQFRQIWEARRRTLGDDHPQTLISERNMAVYHIDTGRPAEAERILRDVIDRHLRLSGEDDLNVWENKGTLASLLLDTGRLDEAASLFEQVLAYRRRVLGDGQENTQNALQHLATTRQAQKRFNEAETLLVELLEIRRRVHGEAHESVADALWNLGRHHVLKGDPAASKRYLDDALARKRSVLGEETAEFAFVQVRYHALLGNRDEALRHLRHAVELGYSRHSELVQHADLASVRQDPRFKKIVAEVKRRNESTSGNPRQGT